MSDEELLRSAGLILKTQNSSWKGSRWRRSFYLARIPLSLSVLPQHKTDAIFRVENVDRYDDRDVIITNLLETYDRMIALWPEAP